MSKSRLLKLLISLALVITLVGGFTATVVSAQDSSPTATPTPTPTPTPTTNPTTTVTVTTTATATPSPSASPTPTPTGPPDLKLTCDVPSYSDNSGASFNYTVNVSYTANDQVMVNLSLTNPPGWTSYLTYSGKEVSSIPLGPLNYGSPDSKAVSINLSPNSGTTPDPGDYKLTLKATTGSIVKTIDLTATVKDKFGFSMTTTDGKLNTTADAGKDNEFKFNANNTGSAALENITFSSSKPEGWTITFNPEKITSLSGGQSQQDIGVIIKPPEGKTVAGDYMITLSAYNSNVSSSMQVRVTVQTSSIWGVVSIIIIVVVIAGLAVLFLRLGRR